MRAVVGRLLPLGGLFTVALAMAGCGRQETAGLQPTGVAVTPSVAERIAAVRSGDSDRLVADRPLTDDEWASLRGLEGLRELVIAQGVANDSRAEIFATLPRLERLVVRESPLTDQGFHVLAACTSLRDLNVPQAACTAEGIRALEALPHLRSLRLGGSTLAGSEVCAALVGLRGLRSLHLIDVPIGDEGLRILAGLSALGNLYLDGAGVSDEAWSEYFRRHPHVHVHVDQAHHDRDPNRDRH